MSTERPDDALLSAWLDGEVEGSEGARAQAWLHESSEDAARVRLWAADRDALRARFAATLDEPVPERLTQTVWRRSVHVDRRPWWLAAAGVAVLAVGVVIGALWRGGVAREAATAATEGWTHRAAVAHAVYAPEERHPVEVSVRDGDGVRQR